MNHVGEGRGGSHTRINKRIGSDYPTTTFLARSVGSRGMFGRTVSGLGCFFRECFCGSFGSDKVEFGN